MKKALIVWGGWDGHEPKQVADIFAGQLRKNDFEVEISNTLDSFKDGAKLKTLDIIIPIWTMGKITGEQVKPVMEAVHSGVGMGGVHGGMCDAFRESTDWQFMTGGQWVAHPGGDGIKYVVNIKDKKHPITKGLKDFDVCSEQYYLHVDPAVKVLATTTFEKGEWGEYPSVMPVVWTKKWGKGRVFYCSVGHNAKSSSEPRALELITRGLIWASEKD